MAPLLRITTLLFISTLAACGGKSFDVNGKEPDDGGSAGQGGRPNVAGAGGKQTGGTGQAGKPSTAGTASGGTAQGGQAPDACEGFDDDGGTFIQVEIANETANAIYLGGELGTCNTPPLFSVKDQNGQELAIDAYCRTTCAQARKNGPSGCPAICSVPSVIALQPNEAYATNFSGLQYVAKTMPKACLSAPYGAAECTQALMVEPGTFSFSSVAGSAVECALSSTQCGQCEPNGQGGCIINGAVRGGTILRATTHAVLDSSYGIYPKNLPPSGEAPSEDPGGAIAPPRIRIVFF